MQHPVDLRFYTATMKRFASAVLSLTIFVSPVIAQPTDGDTRVETVFAEPGMITNPVSFTIDRFGRLYIVESARAGNAVSDTRQLGHLNGVEEDLQLHTVEDRLALINKWIAGGHFEPDYFTRTEDRVVRLLDTNGDGVADESNVFAGGFNDPLDGIASGALWLDDTLFFTNIPHLWALRDTDNDGEADERESLSYGYGVRWCFYGHDLHGLVQGPDGRIYFSMGDRGFNITTREGERLVNPQTGGVFRCWPDGSELELFAQGLRNPQELAFDDFGNLFTGDNNCDSGDKARVVHVVEGSDSGWRQDVQSLGSRGPWNREKIWHTYDKPKDILRPAWTLPPVAHVGAGPSGILHYPGTGENDAYLNHIFMVDFYGSGSTIHTFRMDNKGAWFTLEDKGVYYKGKTVTDISFGYDGRLYLTDWGGGWQPNPNGNVFTIENTTVHTDESHKAAIDEVRSLFAEGFDSIESPRLVALLGHRDQRVRLAAQYELAKEARDARGLAESVAADNPAQTPQIARVHAVWLLRQIARRDAGVVPILRALLIDEDAMIRMQAVKMLADLRDAEPEQRYLELLDDENHQVRFYAALALGKAGSATAIEPLLKLLDDNNDQDPVIRHGASYALSLINRPDELVEAALDQGEGGRIGAIIALRRQKNLGLLAFVRDSNPRVAAEAVRAIYDENIEAGLPAVAKLLETELPVAWRVEPVLRRAVAANVRLGDAASAQRLARFAVWSDLPLVWRKTTLESLLAWNEPLKREGVWGHWVDLPPRAETDARSAVMGVLAQFEAFTGLDADLDTVLNAARARFGANLTPEAMIATIADPSVPVEYRRALVDRIIAIAPDRALDAAQAAFGDSSPEADRLRMRSLDLLKDLGAHSTPELVYQAIRSGTMREQQHAARVLVSMSHPDADDLITGFLQGLNDGSTDPSIALELLSAKTNDNEEFAEAVAAFTNNATNPVLAPQALAFGGDPTAGASIFNHHEAAQCLRCHTIEGTGGTAGPDLTTIGSRLPRTSIIESVLNPNATVTPGYGTISLRLKDGTRVGGILKEEKPGAYIVDAMGTIKTISKNDVQSQIGPDSAMPAVSSLLTPHEIRDVVAFLVAQQDPALGPAVAAVSHAQDLGGGHDAGSKRAGALQVALTGIMLALGAVTAVVMIVLAFRIGSQVSGEQST